MASHVPNKTSDNHIAGLALSILVGLAPQQLTLEEAIVAFERDLSKDEQEVRKALQGLINDGLVSEQNDRYFATRAAIRNDELSF
jgi:threonine aldolase